VPPDPATGDVSQRALAFLLDHRFRGDWPDLYRSLHKVPALHVGHNEWIVAGYEDVAALMKHPAASLAAPFPVTLSPVINELFLNMLPYENDHEHRRLRSLTSPLLSNRMSLHVEPMMSTYLRSCLYPAVFENEGCDVVANIGQHIPTVTSCMLLDIPIADWESVGEWAEILYAQIGRYHQTTQELNDAEAAYRELLAYLWAWSSRHHEPITGLGNSLITMWKQGSLDDRQFVAYFMLFLFTGRDTLTYAITNALWFLANSVKIFATLRANPKFSQEALDEVLRLWGPIRVCIRQLTKPISHRGNKLPESSLLFLLVHAANRDARQFPFAEQFQWGRKAPSRLAFGVGAHGCLGTAVGRMVGRSLFKTLAEECSSLRATPSVTDAEFIPSLPILGVRDLRIYAEPDHRISTAK
jgi:pimeloyl-[acyl-carrier protein] synthase